MNEAQKDILERVVALEQRVHSLEQKPPRSYNERDSEIVDRQTRKPHGIEPIVDRGDPEIEERRRRISEARRTKSHEEQIRAERDRRIHELNRDGTRAASIAISEVINDVTETGRKAIDWIQDNIDVSRGRLRLGSFDYDGAHCVVYIGVQVGPPSIDFGIDCVF